MAEDPGVWNLQTRWGCPSTDLKPRLCTWLQRWLAGPRLRSLMEIRSANSPARLRRCRTVGTWQFKTVLTLRASSHPQKLVSRGQRILDVLVRCVCRCLSFCL